MSKYYDHLAAHSGEDSPPDVHRVGELAYLDELHGWVPVKVIGIDRKPSGQLTVRVTAARPGYRRGEVLHVTGRHTVPRVHVHRRAGWDRIGGRWTWETGND